MLTFRIINVKIVFDREVVKDVYKVETDKEIYKALSNKIKEINQTMPKYKEIRGKDLKFWNKKLQEKFKEALTAVLPIIAISTCSVPMPLVKTTNGLFHFKQ